MVFDKTIEGYFVYMKSIDIDDAEFSYELRKDPRFVSVMGQPASSVEMQRDYIAHQRERAGDYYFVVYSKETNEKIGLIGVYDIHGDTGELGREICSGDSFCAMEARCLLQDFVKEYLDLKYYTFVIYQNNEKVIKLSNNLGYSIESESIRSGIPCYTYRITVEQREEALQKARALIENRAKKKGLLK